MNEDPPAGYIECCEAMESAARKWLAAHPCATLVFVDIFEAARMSAGLPPGTKVAVIAEFDDAIIATWAHSYDARALLLAMKAASKDEGTVLQARAILDVVLSEASCSHLN